MPIMRPGLTSVKAGTENIHRIWRSFYMTDFVKMSKSEYGISVLLFCEDYKHFKIG